MLLDSQGHKQIMFNSWLECVHFIFLYALSDTDGVYRVSNVSCIKSHIYHASSLSTNVLVHNGEVLAFQLVILLYRSVHILDGRAQDRFDTRLSCCLHS